MTRDLRLAHRVIWPILAVLVPTAVGRSIRARPSWVVDRELPAAASNIADASPVQRATRFEGIDVGVAVHDASVELRAAAPLHEPDPLIYWSAARAGAALPDGAVFLGVLGAGPRRFALPASAGGSGFLVAYSLANARVLGNAALGSAP